MKNLFKVLAMTSVSLLAFQSASAHARGLSVVCGENGRTMVKDSKWESGCWIPGMTYYKTLALQASGPEGGNINFSIDSTFPEINPHCDNPRGMPYHQYLPLPINQGEWEIFHEGEMLGVVSFTATCEIKPSQSAQ